MPPKRQYSANLGQFNDSKRKTAIVCDDNDSHEAMPLLSMNDYQWGNFSTSERQKYLEENLFGKKNSESQMRNDDEECKEENEEDESSSFIPKVKPQPPSVPTLQLKPVEKKRVFFLGER